MTERLDHLARVSVQQDETGDRHVEREPEQGRDEEVRGEDREVEDAAGRHAHEQGEYGERDVADEQQVDQWRPATAPPSHHDADDRAGIAICPMRFFTVVQAPSPAIRGTGVMWAEIRPRGLIGPQTRLDKRIQPSQEGRFGSSW